VSVFAALPRSRGPFTIAVCFLTLIGAFLRAYALGGQSLWFEEVCSWHSASYSTFAGLWQGDRAWNFYPPGYRLLLNGIMSLFGDAEWILRLPSAIAGVLAVPMIYILGARLFSEREGLVAAGILSLSVFPIYYAQESRPYSLLILSVIASSVAWTWIIEAWTEKRSAPLLVLIGCFTANVACAYLHYFGLFFVFLQGIVSFLLCARNFSGLARAGSFYLLSAIAFAPWLPTMLWQFRRQEVGPQNPKPGANIVVSFYEFIKGLFSHGQMDTRVADVIAGFVLVALIIAMLRALLDIRAGDPPTRRKQIAFAAVIAVWLFAPFLFAYVKSTFSASVYTHRNLSITLPAIYLLAARGLLSVPFPNLGRVAVGVLLVIAAMARLLTSAYYTAPHKDQLREAVAFVRAQEHAAPNALLVTYSNLPFTFDYYLQRQGSALRSELVAGRAEHIESMRQLVRSRRPDVVWYICTDPYPENAFVDYLNTEFAIVGVQQLLRVNVFQLIPR